MRRALVAMVGPPRSATLALAEAIERVDRMRRQWSAAGLALLVLAILLGAAMLAGGLREPAATRKQNSAEFQRLSALVSSQLWQGHDPKRHRH
jgi:predicted negative regulator of RcsB-dependent stress response